jgi:hypothetical protein
VIAYEPTEWHELFVAMAGAAAALAGLLFVAVSINLSEILKSRMLPRRAVEALAIMVTAVIVSVLILTPGQTSTALGTELLIVGVLGGSVLVIARLRTPTAGTDAMHRTVFPMVGLVLSYTPIAIAGLSLLIKQGGGLYWLVPALVIGLLVAVTNAWVLLVEINR